MAVNYEQDPFVISDNEFAVNPETRCACLLLLDTSSSMTGSPIRELNEGLITLRDELLEDNLA